MNDTAGNLAQAGANPHPLRRGIGRMASACHWLGALLSRAFPRRDRGPSPTRPAVGRDVDLIIARRAIRLNNRSPEATARYERVHTILDRGRA